RLFAARKPAAARALPALEALEGRLVPSVSFLPTGLRPTGVAVRDFNGDGQPDFVTSNSGANTVTLRLGLGNGQFLPPRPFAAGAGPSSLAPGDFNRDGRPDLVVTNASGGGVSILLNAGAGKFLAPRFRTVATNPSDVAVADFNRDGKLDLAVTASGSDA